MINVTLSRTYLLDDVGIPIEDPYMGELVACNDKFAEVLRQMDYQCYEKYYQHGQWCYVFQRDPWEAQIVIRTGKFNDKFEQYCQVGDVAA